MRLKNIDYPIFIIFFVFIVLHLFSLNPTIATVSDEWRYVHLAESLPGYTLFNDEVYLNHPPGYPIAIRAMMLFINDSYTAGVLTSFLFSIGAFIMVWLLLRLFNLPSMMQCVILSVFSLSYELGFYTVRPSKETMILFLTLFLIYHYIKYLRTDKNKSFFYTVFGGMILALTTDLVIFAFPLFILCWFIFAERKQILHDFLLVYSTILMFSAWASWVAFKAVIYRQSYFLSVENEGIIVSTANAGILQAVTPFSFPELKSLFDLGFGFDPLRIMSYVGYLFNSYPFPIQREITYHTASSVLSNPLFLVTILLFYTPLFILFIIGLSQSFKHLKHYKGNIDVFMLGMLIIALLPIIQAGTVSRYSLYAIVPIAYFIAQGLAKTFNKITVSLSLAAIVTALLLTSMFIWVGFHNNFVGSVRYESELSQSRIILPDGVYMSQIGYTTEVIAIQGKRAIGMPLDPKLLDEQIRRYNVSYLLFGNHYWDKPILENKDRVFNYDTIQYIRGHPEKYNRVMQILEKHNSTEMPDDIITVYRVGSSD